IPFPGVAKVVVIGIVTTEENDLVAIIVVNHCLAGAQTGSVGRQEDPGVAIPFPSVPKPGVLISPAEEQQLALGAAIGHRVLIARARAGYPVGNGSPLRTS